MISVLRRAYGFFRGSAPDPAERGAASQKAPLFYKIATTIIALCIPFCLSRPAQAGTVLYDEFVLTPFSHHIWQEVINQVGQSPRGIEFTAIRLRPRRLNQYLNQLAKISPVQHPEAFPMHADRLAYWINAYNAVALKEALDIYPTDNWAQTPDFPDWKHYALGGQLYSLNDIGRFVMAESTHPLEAWFALTQYTDETPSLYAEAFEPTRLADQLDAAWRQLPQKPNVMHFEQHGRCVSLALSEFFKPVFAGGASEMPVTIQSFKSLVPPGLFPYMNNPCSGDIHWLPAHRRFSVFYLHGSHLVLDAAGGVCRSPGLEGGSVVTPGVFLAIAPWTE